MYLGRIQIANFRNFAAVDAPLTQNAVILGENRVGKSNFIFALRLVLDTNLPDSARQLKLTDIWDGCDLAAAPEVQIHLDFFDFDEDPALLALFTDYRLPTDPTVARLSYVFRKKADVNGPPRSEADYEFKLYGGAEEARTIRSDVRRRLSIDVLQALRDAENELGTWRQSPLRPLLEDATGQIPTASLSEIADEIGTATQRLTALDPISSLEANLRRDIAALAGTSQDIRAKLAFAPTDPLRLFRSLGLFIDDGKRSIADASLGSANLALLSLKLAEFNWRRMKNERNYTFVCVEEPEAHLHPHLQRQVFQKLFDEAPCEPRALFLTTHSPNVASVAPLKSIVLLKSCGPDGTHAFSLAHLRLGALEQEDLQRYLDTNRADILFSRGVIFVEGDAEAALLPVFAKTCEIDLDARGIAVCNVGGVNFTPYVKLATALGLPFVVVTDWDPGDGAKPPLGRKRAIELVQAMLHTKGEPPLTPAACRQLESDDTLLRETARNRGIFLNSSTLELEIALTEPLIDALLSVLESEDFGPSRRARIEQWKVDRSSIHGDQLMAMIADIGKGRLAGRLAIKATGLPPPAYIKDAINHVANNA